MVARNRRARKRTWKRGYLKIPGSSVRAGEVLGAPGRAGAAHIVQFRAVGIEGLGHELAPESAEFSERLGQAVAVSRG